MFHRQLQALLDAGLVVDGAAGYELAPGVVVSERGFVGRLVRPSTVFGDGVPFGMWVRERKPLPSSSPALATAGSRS